MKVLVANRGEIAVRILRACRELGFPSVAVYSEVDGNARHVRFAEEAVCIGPANAAESYLNIGAVIAAARQCGADAVHPGYGFLSENEAFARAVESEGMIFIGPRPKTIGQMGNKLTARQIAEEAGLPVLHSLNIELSAAARALDLCRDLTFPLLVKAVAGGGGRGIREANNLQELEQVIEAASQEAGAVFGNDAVYIEPLVRGARHIEVQILGDGHGKVLILGERECSIQRRRQKLIEEAPAPNLSDILRQAIHKAAWQLGQWLNYRSLGTVEFLLDQTGNFYFIEVNPRIQVEHPVTEMVTGVDLVAAQLQLAATGQLNYQQEQISVRGSSIECRIIAEDPECEFLPDTGVISDLAEPQGPGVRVDSALFVGMPVTSDYDSMLGKLIVWGETREAAARRMGCALQEFRISGVKTALPFLGQIIQSQPFLDGNFDTNFLDQHQPQLLAQAEKVDGALVAVALCQWLLQYDQHHQAQPDNGSSRLSQLFTPWRMAALQEQVR
jgi:acetyl-CoA carboxylase, biotin carboxylase subunit